ncbi:hypothetical protein WD019_15140 [Fictibacillus sp. Mic-4]|uniref:hypothetical protein n=1 Tax=Fictibacillus sp. Mic-4 TaxID=3132826 RepID=UPI003CE7B076
MGIQRLKPVSGGTDWSKYSSFYRRVQSPVLIQSTNYPSADLINIRGSGFLERVWLELKCGDRANLNYEMQLILDEIIILKLVKTDSIDVQGNRVIRLVLGESSTTDLTSLPLQFNDVGSLGTGEKGITGNIANRLFFKNSLRVVWSASAGFFYNSPNPTFIATLSGGLG